MAYPITILAISLGLAASPPTGAQMAANGNMAGATPRAATQTARPQTQAAAPEKTYCTSGTISGSRMVKQECKTKAQWAKEGVDINDLLSDQQ